MQKVHLSQLRHHHLAATDGRAASPVIVLHDALGHSGDPLDFARLVAPDAEIWAPEAARSYMAVRTILGHSWFTGSAAKPEPSTFGDSLAELERFTYDVIDRQITPAKPFVIGVGQGGSMAIAMAAVLPDALAGVVSIRGRLPVVRGWEPPLAPLDGLPVLLFGDDEHQVTDDAETVTRWGGQVSVHMGLDQAASEEKVAGTVRDWLAD